MLAYSYFMLRKIMPAGTIAAIIAIVTRYAVSITDTVVQGSSFSVCSLRGNVMRYVGRK